MSVGAAISSGFCVNTYGICSCYKFLNAYFETVEARLISNCGEFAIIKIGIVYFLPNTYVFKGVAVPQPISNEKKSPSFARNISVKQI